RLQVNYVMFPLTNFLSEATNQLAKMTNLDAQVEQAFRENPTNLLEQVKAFSLEDAKVKVRERKLRDFETIAARRKAAEFAYQLEETNATSPEVLPQMAKQQGLIVGLTAPFDQMEGPKDLNVGPGFASLAFSLTNTPFAGPLLGDDAVYVISI